MALPSLAAELAITASNGEVWLSIGEALLFGGGSLLFGTWVARTVGLLRSDAPAGETLGVGLATGLMVLAAWWAAIWSGGRSSFTPVAVGLGVAITLAVAQRAQRRTAAVHTAEPSSSDDDGATIRARPPRRRHLVLAALAGATFVVAVALLYGSTLAPSPRDGAQPVERTDVALYAVLGADLAATGTETNTLPAGFSELPGAPAQTWYHWGELWLASAVITVFGAAPLSARYLVVLPLLLLAAAAMTGTLVRRVNGTASRPAYLFGFLACLVLAPIPLISGPFFSVWAAGLIFGITVFGLAAVAVLLALYSLAVLGTLQPTWALACFVASAVALILPAHVVLALLALVGVGAAWMIRIGRSLLAARRLPALSEAWRRTFIATAIALLATVAGGLLTGHGLGVSGGLALNVSPFNASWRDTVAIVTLGAGMLLTIPIAWLLARRDAPLLADICLGTMALLVAGAIAWGWRLATFNMFYLFFGGIAVFATPIAAVAVWLLLDRLRRTRHRAWVIPVVVLCAIQLELGALVGLGRIQGGAGVYEPIPVSLLRAIGQLPEDAKLAYACQSFEEISFVNSKLLSIDAHTGHRIVPMCFEADVNGPLLGAPVSAQTPDAGFPSSPQAALYPDSTARPTSDAVAAFLKAHGIDYIYADAAHPNSLVASAVPVATSGGFELLRVP